MKASKFVASSIALAAAGFATCGVAATTDVNGELYGDFRYALSHFDADGFARDTDLEDTNSHVGIKATARQGQTSATLVYERTLDNDDNRSSTDSVRQSYLTIGSAFGALTYGRAPTAYKLSGQKLDPFYNTGIGTTLGLPYSFAPGTAGLESMLGPSFGLSELTSDVVGTGFINNQIAYTTPSIAGLSFNAAVFVSEDEGTAEDHDYGAGVEWSGQGITAGIQHLAINSTASITPNFDDGLLGGGIKLKSTRYYAGYAQQNWGVGLSHEDLDRKGGVIDAQYYYGSLWATVLPGTRAAIAYGMTNEAVLEGNNISVGLFHDVFKGLEVYLAARKTDLKDGDPDLNSMALGVNYNFSLKMGGKM